MINRMYRLCNVNKWFTSGSVEQYNKLFDMVREGRSARDLALVIYMCSDGWSEIGIYIELCREGFPRESKFLNDSMRAL